MTDAAQRILVVDDEENIRLVVSAALFSAGFSQVTGAADGREAARLCTSTKFDLVITDILMPETDGLELILTLRKNQPGIRIIAMSGGGSIDAGTYLKMAEQCGASILLKPFKVADLVNLVRQEMAQIAPD
jgi:DNA-binding NtrC family response regulator